MRKSRLLHTFFKTEKPDYTPKIMKFCPTCQIRYDEEILRFCTKDGTPLIEEEQPIFTELPSESVAADADEETIVRRKSAADSLPPSQPGFNEKPTAAPRIVIPTTDERQQQQVRTSSAAYQTATQKTNTAKVVLMTILGTVIILAGAGGVFWLLQSENAGNTNSDVNSNIYNVNTNPPTNLNIGNSFNFNVGNTVNTNVNTNVNVNIKTPTPTPKPSPTPTPTPRPSPDANSNISTNANSTLPTNTRPSPSSTPTPSATPTPPAVNRPVNAGLLNSRAVNLTTPAYPSAAKAVRAAGRVTVQVLVDEGGNVMSARAVSGHPLLRQAAEAAARQSRFNPIRVNNRAVSATGILVYNFVN